MEKKLFWLVESNGELSVTVNNLDQAKELIEGDFENEEDKEEVQYTLTPKMLTSAEFEALPEAD